MTVDELLNEVRENKVVENKLFKSANWNFSNCNFNDVHKIVFKNCVFADYFNFRNLTNENLDIEFQNCSFKVPIINYFKTIHCNQFHLDNCSSESTLFIDCTIQNLAIENTSISNDLNIHTCNINTLLVANEEGNGYINSFLIGLKRTTNYLQPSPQLFY